jgi:hypothetical protein
MGWVVYMRSMLEESVYRLKDIVIIVGGIWTGHLLLSDDFFQSLALVARVITSNQPDPSQTGAS